MQREAWGVVLTIGLLALAVGCGNSAQTVAPSSAPTSQAPTLQAESAPTQTPPDSAAGEKFAARQAAALRSATSFGAYDINSPLFNRAAKTGTIEEIRALLQSVKVGGAVTAKQAAEQLQTLPQSGDFLVLNMEAKDEPSFRLLVFGETTGLLREREGESYYLCGDVRPILQAISLITAEDSAAKTLATSETDPTKIGAAAFESYENFYMGDDVNVWQRVTAFKIKESKLVAGDAEELCVSCVYDITPFSVQFMSANGTSLLDGSWVDCTLEVRVKRIADNTYRIVKMGTGGVGAGLALPAGSSASGAA